jgi:hypothetical protein
MINRWWLAPAWVCLVPFVPMALPQVTNHVPETTRLTDCGESCDRRYSVCRGAWSGKTVALFNTWMAPDTNPGRRLDLPLA